MSRVDELPYVGGMYSELYAVINSFEIRMVMQSLVLLRSHNRVYGYF